MEALGINTGLLFIQVLISMMLIALPILSLIDLARKNLSGMPLAIWVLVICAIPLLGCLAYWIVKPTAESRV